ncbi:hypothetical protein HLB23_30535 [Nocardia uniformis]|uniref:Uncharacterized protein n=1 Tax=Nocardia uniformis TaxID=53432 RepID=A0A849C8S8_9NOCA|nr:hypothetical protein [Nocardia uniformis]NNH74138.1 hypothetical protein [Nocardia uniformis]
MLTKLKILGILAAVLLGVPAGVGAVATAETKIPVHSGFSSGWECLSWTLDRAAVDGYQYDCQDFGRNGGWTALWIVD